MLFVCMLMVSIYQKDTLYTNQDGIKLLVTQPLRSTYKLDNIKEGYVYVIINPAWPEWVKIGMAIDAEDRCNGYQTSSPHRDYKLKYAIETDNRRALEQAAHKEASKLASESKGEWFKLDVETAIEILNNLREQNEPRKRSA